LIAEPGTQLTASTMKLRRGLVKIAFDDGAEIVLQAPCRFKLENTNQMFLESGNLAAVVPERAYGFTVRTPGATVVDYGTEFGVTAHATGETEAHVFKGEVDLRSGSDIRVYQHSQRLRSGEANRVDRAGIISKKKFKAKRNRFIREITKEESFSRPGQRLDLADMIGGGNGFGTGERRSEIDPITGRLFEEGLITKETGRFGSGKYTIVNELLYIDGVFVPDGDKGPLTISSTGLKFNECPDTSGKVYANIRNSGIVYELDKRYQLYLGGHQCGTRTFPAILMHSNVGITFDLGTIRQNIPGIDISKFTALAGISETAMQSMEGKVSKMPQAPYSPVVDLYVLVDGQIRARHKSIQIESGLLSVEAEIGSNERYLTLIVTDSDGRDQWDWFVLAQPALELAQKN
jgi:hypothetical protein